MAKVKTIAGVTYYPIKQHPDGICNRCGDVLCNHSLVYLIGKRDSNEMNCANCVNELFAESNKIKNLEADCFPTENWLLVGERHGCRSVTLESVPFYFENDGKSRKITIEQCPKCRRYVVPLSVYSSNLFYFEKYKMLKSSTHKPHISSVAQGLKVSHIKREYEKTEIPESLQWAAKHPYQGGSFSGK